LKNLILNNNSKLLTIKYLPTHINFLIFKVLIKLPYKTQIFLGKKFGYFLKLTFPKKRKIVEKNISICYPEMNKTQVEFLRDKNFESIGVSFFEIANALFSSNKKIENLFEFSGFENLDKLVENESLIILTSHFTPMLIIARALLLKTTIGYVYRPQNNLLFNRYMEKSFKQNGAIIIGSKDTKSMILALKNKIPLWYAPDQDLGYKNSIFAPFFNIKTATITSTSRLAKINNSRILHLSYFRSDNNKYKLMLSKPLKNIPTDNFYADCVEINRIIEKDINICQDQYLWVHKRFKTRPEGEENYYKNL